MTRTVSCSVKFFGFFLFFAFLGIQLASSQATTGSIYGQVTDASSAVIVGAKVTALNLATGATYPGTSDGQGNFVVFNLIPGVYNVTVEKEGFETATVKSARIVIDQ